MSQNYAVQVFTDVLHNLPEQPTVRPKYNRQHLFHDILTQSASLESPAAQLDMIYHFSLYQRCLEQIRRKAVHAQHYWLEKVRVSPLRISSERAKNGMDALYFPMVGNKKYAEKKYDEAENSLKKGIAALTCLYAEGFDFALIGCMEQNLNMFRVYWSSGKEELALEVALDLLGFLHTGKKNARFDAADLLQMFGTEVCQGLIDFYFDIVILKLVQADKPVLLGKLFSSLHAMHGDNRFNDAKYAIQVLATLYSQTERADLPVMPETFSLSGVPGCVQILLLMALRNRSGDASQVQSRLDTYCSALYQYKTMAKYAMHM